MRLSIDHRTTYRFSTPQARLVQMLRLTPQNTHDQTVASWRIDVDCDATMRPGHDGFGNAITMLYAEGPLDGIEIAVLGEVLTSQSGGVLNGADEVLPPPLFLRATPATPADPAIADFAAKTAGEREPMPALHALSAGLHERFERSLARPDPTLIAGTAFAGKTATARDLAQIFVVAARSLGRPARYVAGYRRNPGEEHRPAPHAWAEAFVDDIGWVGFDPCTGLPLEEEYVRVAAALDAPGASPIAGSRLGEGEEELDVEVMVVRED